MIGLDSPLTWTPTMKLFPHLKLTHIALLLLPLSPSFLVAKENITPPAATTEMTFISNGNRMSGFIYHPEGVGPHPTALLLHGYPGNEKNLDVAQALRASGWNVVFFHYRGAWGSEGEFSFMNAEDDVSHVLDYIHSKDNAEKLRIDTDRISVIGHSMGGHMALAGIFNAPFVKCAVTYDGANLGVGDVGIIDDPETNIPWRDYSDTLFMLKGWSSQKAVNELKLHGKALNLVRRVDKINRRPVLFVVADSPVIPVKSHITPLVEALRKTEHSDVTYKLIRDDHSFNSTRAELIKTTSDFLNTKCSS